MSHRYAVPQSHIHDSLFYMYGRDSGSFNTLFNEINHCWKQQLIHKKKGHQIVLFESKDL